MSLKQTNHKVRLQSDLKIHVNVPVAQVDTSISTLATQRRALSEPQYSGENPDIAYKSVMEQRHILERVKEDNNLYQEDIHKFAETQDYKSKYLKSKETKNLNQDGE